MGAVDNLAQGRAIAELQQQVRSLMLATPNNSSSIGSGGLRVHSGGMITIENGGLRVTGTAEIIGQLIASGSITFNGPVRITGPLDITGLTQIMGDLVLKSGGKFTAGTIELNPDGSAKFGTLTISPTGKLTSGEATINPDGSAKFGQFDIAANGNLDSKGTLDIKGKSTLQDDLTVQGGGKIKVGANMTLNPATGGGRVEFTNGAAISSSGTDLKMNATGAGLSLGTQAVMTGGTSTMVMAGASTSVTTPLFMLSGRVMTSSLAVAPAGAKANVYCDPSTGELKRIVG